MCVRFLKINKLLKTSLVLFLIASFLYLPPMFLKFKNPVLQRELIDDVNILKANFSKWIPEITLDNNIHLIIALTLISFAVIFLISGLIKYLKNKNR